MRFPGSPENVVRGENPGRTNLGARLWHSLPSTLWKGNGLPVPSPEDLTDPGIEPMSLVSPALAGGFFTTMPPGKFKRKMVMPISQGYGGDEM